jgi:iron complex outermembrane receptor protein
VQQVTVSATRRRELIREVPLAISSVESERLVEVGARNLNDFLATQPGVVLQNVGVLDGSGFVIIRGLTSGADSNSPTAIYFNDVPLAAGTTFDVDLMDLRSFEVLRGPQGTLYGSSAMGGVVKYIANEPDTSGLSGSVLLGLSSTQDGGTGYQGTGTVNIPLKADFAALRVAAFSRKDAGWVDATGPAGTEDVNQNDSYGGRASLLVTPTRQLSINLTALTQTRNSDGNSRVVFDPATKAPVAGDRTYTDLFVAEPRKGKRELYSGTIEYDFDWARFTSVTAYQKAEDTSVCLLYTSDAADDM